MAELCVKCGLCLPHCPTYDIAGTEPESPRGRIALVQGLAAGALDADDTLAAHLDQCLGCRACEAVCPARVPYGAIVDAGQALLREAGRPASRVQRLLGRAVAHRRLIHAAVYLLKILRPTGLVALVRRLARSGGALGAAARIVPRRLPAPGLRADYPPADPVEARGDVFLFLGCVAAGFDVETHRSAVEVLRRSGFRVRVPPAQTCCGALAQHSGDVAAAGGLARRNVEAFGSDASSPVATTASGCAATLLDYGRLDGRAMAVSFAGRVRDFGELVDVDRLAPALGRLPLRALLHEPCTQRNVVRRQAAVRRLLDAVPGLEVMEMPGNDRCCGAAGSHFLTHPDRAATLLAPKLRAIAERDVDLVVTTNPGCALHLAADLPDGPEVVHPATVLARSLAAGGNV